MLSVISGWPALPARAGAVPSRATFPVTAGPQVPAVLSASAGTEDAQEPPLDGSPMISSEYALNCAVVIASQVAGVATVTVYPVGTACASALDEPPVTLVDKISTEPETAWAALAVATPAAASATVPVATTEAGTTSPDPSSAGASNMLPAFTPVPLTAFRKARSTLMAVPSRTLRTSGGESALIVRAGQGAVHDMWLAESLAKLRAVRHRADVARRCECVQPAPRAAMLAAICSDSGTPSSV